MRRLHLFVEGPTEEAFVNRVLRPHLIGRSPYSLVSARILGDARRRQERGGIRGWPSVKRDLELQLKSDSLCRVGTLVDYYGLPADGDRAWPGRAEASKKPISERAEFVQTAIREDLRQVMGQNFDPSRFVPLVLLHEFEALLFSNLDWTRDPRFPNRFFDSMLAVREKVNSPEEIDDGPNTSPSKRILEAHPGYRKVLDGPPAAEAIGLPAIMDACPHFAAWLRFLER